MCCHVLRFTTTYHILYLSLFSFSPSVSPAVEEAHFDDDKTPIIPLTFIEDECEPPPAAAAVSGLGPELSLAACAALSALTKEQGCQIDADLLFKLLSDPKIVTKLMNDMKAKPLETENNSLNTFMTEPRLAPQHVTSTAMDRNPPPVSRTHPGNGVPHSVPVSVQSSATDPPLPNATQPMSGALSMNLNHQIPTSTYPLSSGLKPLPRLEDSSSTADPLKPSPVDDVVVSEQKTQSLHISTLSTWNMNRVPESARTETDSQIRNGNKNPDDQVPVKNLDYFKNLIREHGGVKPATNETNNYKGRVDDMKVVKVKFQKPCMFFNRAKGCRLGESCLYLHDRSKRLCTDAAPHFPRAKRLKFGS